MKPGQLSDLDPALARAAREVASRLRDAGHGAWIVGGCARDLCLGRPSKDLDMVTGALPEEIEGLFEMADEVGRSFGIVLVRCGGEVVEVATFRSEAGYQDGRHPDEVRFGSTMEEDAARRDFTCNALFLDPLSGEWCDFHGGIADLGAGVLRTVGEARQRFEEDGLRLLRMARFQASLDLELAPGLFEAARESLASLRGVSPERVLGELTRICESPRAHVALATLLNTGILSALHPAWAAADKAPDRADRLSGLPDPPGAALGLAFWLEADPKGAAHSDQEEHLDHLRPSKDLRRTVLDLWRRRRALAGVLTPAERARLLRDPGWREAILLARLWDGDTEALDALESWRASASQEELFPTPLLGAEDLRAAGLEPGPRFGECLRQLEDQQLAGELEDKPAALEWLARWKDAT